ncbi:MAG: hypothetical protein ACFFDN_02485 [Candidatus Hodarchaeota archaeon]
MKRLVAPVTVEYNQGDTPATTGLVGFGAKVYNSDTTNSMTITFIHTDTESTTITIPASTIWSDFVIPFKGITVAGSSTSYLIQVKEDNF